METIFINQNNNKIEQLLNKAVENNQPILSIVLFPTVHN